MPKIKITEIDNTGSFTLAEQPNMVYIPGASASSSKTKPVVYKTLKAFKDDSSKYLTEDASYLLALKLLKLGMQVLYQGFPLEAGTVEVEDSHFIINDIDYSLTTDPESGDPVSISWDDDEHTSMVDELWCADIADSKVKIGLDGSNNYIVTYPVAISESKVAIVENKFTINEVEYTLGNNEITYDASGTPTTISVVNGKAILSNGESATIDYLHNVVEYKQVYVSEGSISMTSDDWKVLEDRNLYNVRFLTTGGYACPSNAMIACAANRGDAVALIDHENYDTYNVSTIRDYFEGFETATSKQSDTLAFSAGYTPWFTAKLEKLNDEVVEEEVPASFGYLMAYARSLSQNPLWKAVAGVRRGYIPELVDVNYEYNNAECEMLQARAADAEVDLDETGDNVGMAINPIAYKRYAGFTNGFAFVINGNRTMLVNAGSTKATSFMNVRVLISELSKALYDASVANNFEQNSEVLWFKFTSMVTPLLDRMTSGEGIEGYRLIRLATDKKARLKAKLIITPIEAVEDFEIEISLEDSIEVNE